MMTKIKVTTKGISVLSGDLTVDDLHALLEEGIIMPIVATGKEIFLNSTPNGKWEREEEKDV